MLFDSNKFKPSQEEYQIQRSRSQHCFTKIKKKNCKMWKV